jgi:hypothetical protein
MRVGVALGWVLLFVGTALAVGETEFPDVSCAAASVPVNVRLCVTATLFWVIIAGIAIASVGVLFILSKPRRITPSFAVEGLYPYDDQTELCA